MAGERFGRAVVDADRAVHGAAVERRGKVKEADKPCEKMGPTP
jgi:hypothetical protein